MSRFKLECVYSNYEKRALFFVVDFETPLKQGEFSHLRSRRFGNHTEMFSVQPVANVKRVSRRPWGT
jgi:hypothetical protein